MAKNTLYDGYEGPRLPKAVLVQRVNRVIEEEMTPLQREVLLAYYIQDRKVTDIAADRGVHKTTIYRTLHRAERKLRRYLRY